MLDQSLFTFLSISIYYHYASKIVCNVSAPFTNLTKNLPLQQQQYSSTQHFTDYLNETAENYKESSVNNYFFMIIVRKENNLK